MIGALLVVLLAASAWASERAKSSVAVFLQFENEPSAASIEQMKNEVAAIMQPSGLTLDWHRVEDNRGTEAFAELVLVRFKGRCYMDGAPPEAGELEPFGERMTLASTKVVRGRVLPFSEVKCDQIRKSITALGDAKFALGRALGRVVAHELFHILGRTTSHTRAGVTKAVYSSKDLVR